MSESESTPAPEQQSFYPYAPTYQTQNSDLIRLALSSSDLLEDLRMNLLGLRFNPDTEKFVQVDKPMMLEKGVNKLVAAVGSLVNRNTDLSNVPQERVYLIAREFEMNLNDMFLNSWKEFWTDEWEAENNWPTVRAMAGNYVLLALLRAMNGGERNILGGNTKTLNTNVMQESSQKISQTQNSAGRLRFLRFFK